LISFHTIVLLYISIEKGMINMSIRKCVYDQNDVAFTCVTHNG
jgi:hypothetical protein